MSPVLARHFIGETYRTLFAVIAILVLVYVSNRLARYLADVAAGELLGSMLLALLALKLAAVLVILVPAAFYLALLLVLGRMHSDGEMVALAASGSGPAQLYRYVLLAALPVALLNGWLALQLVPWTEALAERTLEQARSAAALDALAPGRFAEAGKDLVYHVQSLDTERRMQGLFVYLPQARQTVVIGAREGRLESDAQSGDRYLVLRDGHRYDGEIGRGDYRVYGFDSYRVRVASGTPPVRRPRSETQDSAALWESDDPPARAELQWRLAQPVAVLVLALLAVPISHSRPRQGRYARLLFALLVYVVYVNLLGAGRSLLAGAAWPPWAGLWWVHVPLLALAWLLLWQRYGWRRPPPPAPAR